MIYSASLNVPVKKALSDQAQSSNLAKICDQLKLDPDTTKMDVVILGPKDLIGPKAVKVKNSMASKHPDICVIYVYQKDAERDLIDCEYKKQCKKITPQEVRAAFEEFVGPHKVRQGKQRITSADFDAVPNIPSSNSATDLTGMEPGDDEFDTDMPDQIVKPNIFMQQAPTSVAHATSDDDDEFPSISHGNEESQSEVFDVYTRQPHGGHTGLLSTRPHVQNDEAFATPQSETTMQPSPTATVFQGIDTDADNLQLEQKPLESSPFIEHEFPQPTSMSVSEPSPTIENSLANVNSYEEWSLFKEHLNHRTVVESLIAENSEYVGLVNMLDVLDKRIETIWRDTVLSAEQKFEKIKAIGLEKSIVRATQNSINVDKVISIINTIILSAKRTVEEKLSNMDAAMYKLTTDKASMCDTSYIDRAIEDRTKTQLELLNLSRSIVDLYKSIDKLVVDEIKELDRKLPSSNAFINDMVKPIGTQIFTPANTASLANKLMKSLQENTLIASQLEESVNAVIDRLFQLCQKDEEIIRYQQNMINMLKAQHVEDVVIADTLLKKILRIYVGADNTGRSATAITWCGILSRRQNCLLIDLTGRSKFREYGITPMSLDDFLATRTEQQFLCVESNEILSPERLQDLITDLKSRLNYYPYVNVILAPEDTNGLDQLSEEALCVHYITDCSTSSIRTMHDVITQHKTKNIARKLITIDTPVSPLMIADSVGIDPTITKIVALPTVNAIRACALRHDRPYEFNDVIRVFEEAFK